MTPIAAPWIIPSFNAHAKRAGRTEHGEIRSVTPPAREGQARRADSVFALLARAIDPLARLL